MRHVIALGLFLAVICAVAPVRAAEDADYRKLNQVIVSQHILPRYQTFMAATDRLATAAEQTCATRATGELGALKTAFIAAMQDWEAIQHVRFGPVEFFSRASRIYFWPDPRASAATQLDDLLAKEDSNALAPDSFAKSSVAVQGFPALEILLYGDDAGAKLAAGTAAGAYRCAVLVTIARNLQVMGRELDEEWRSGADPYGALLDRAGPDDLRFRHASEVTIELFKALYGDIELVADHKLARPLGASAQAARPRLAEAWRSKQSLANIQRNLAAAQAMYDGENGSGGISAFLRDVIGDSTLDGLMKRAFAQTAATANGITVPLEDGIGKAPTRAQFDKLAREAKALKALLVQRLAPALGIPVGFNQLDGD